MTSLTAQNGTIKKNGFTLVETIVAFGLLLAALVGPVSLITQGLAGASASKNKLIASHLAQEGIELARAVRDNNILCEVLGHPAIQWASDPNDPTGGLIMQREYELDANQPRRLDCNTMSGTFIPNAMFPSPGCSGQALLLNSAGVYTYVSGTPSAFSRCVRICSPPNAGSCAPFPGSAPDGGGIDDSDQMEIIAEVTWNERGTGQNLILRERLYNWR